MQLTTDIIYLVSFPHIRGIFFEVIVIIVMIKIIPDYNAKQVLAAPLPPGAPCTPVFPGEGEAGKVITGKTGGAMLKPSNLRD